MKYNCHVGYFGSKECLYISFSSCGGVGFNLAPEMKQIDVYKKRAGLHSYGTLFLTRKYVQT